jgi:hypothetical protein
MAKDLKEHLKMAQNGVELSKKEIPFGYTKMDLILKVRLE